MSRDVYQTLGTGLSGIVDEVDIAYYADTTYYGVTIRFQLEECSSDEYGDCHNVAEGLQSGRWDGLRTFDMGGYNLNPCKYYRFRTIGVGPWGQAGNYKYYGSYSDTYSSGSFSHPDLGLQDLFFIMHGVDSGYPAMNCVDPVIIVPGLFGSMEKNGNLVLDPILHAYDDLVATLIANGYVSGSTLFTFPYNWRNSNTDTAILLKQKIDEIKQICQCEKVDIVAHSMGGLATRYYIQSVGYGNDIDQVIFLAVPHKGAPKSYLPWEGGSYPAWSLDDMIINRIISREGKRLGFENSFEYIKNRPVASIGEILPIYNYKMRADENTSDMVAQSYPNDYPRNYFLENLYLNKDKMSRIRYVNMIGNIGTSTIGSIITYEQASTLAKWEHGIPINLFENSGLPLVAGDGTVPLQSSIDLGSDFVFASNHTNIIDEASAEIFKNLTGRDPETIIRGRNHVDLKYLFILLVGGSSDAVIVAPDGRRTGRSHTLGEEYNEIPDAFYSDLESGDRFITIPDPIDGEYSVIAENTEEYTLTVSQISPISSNNTLESEFTHTVLPSEPLATAFNISGDELSFEEPAPEPEQPIEEVVQEVVQEVEKTLDFTAVPEIHKVQMSRGGGGGASRRAFNQATSIPETVNMGAIDPDKFVIFIDLPIGPVEQNPIKNTQLASVHEAINDSPVGGWVAKIKGAIKKMFSLLNNTNI